MAKEKPKAVYMARAEIALFCECGAQLEKTAAGTYVCRGPGCRWEGRELYAVIMPAMPSFYHQPQSIDDLVAQFVYRVCAQIGLPQAEQFTWHGGSSARAAQK